MKLLGFLFLVLLINSCKGQEKEIIVEKKIKSPESTIKGNNQPLLFNSQEFNQQHSTLNGMVSEFVRTMHQDKYGNYWFGTNGDGIIRYDGQTLEKLTIAAISPNFRVLEIVEDEAGNLWFGTSEGLIKYEGEKFRIFSNKEGLLPGDDSEIWGLTIDKNGLIWVGSIGGVSQFDGEKFVHFPLPDSIVENPKPMLSDKLVFKIIEDSNGTMWFATDGNGVFKYENAEFTHLTAKNGLTDNNVADIFEDRKRNIWLGTFYGGVSKYDGETFNNFTEDGIIEGIETYNFCEDNKGNVWFSAENHGVYRYDGANFTQFTKEDGLATNTIQHIFEDKKGQIWMSTWNGLSMFDGKRISNASNKEQWAK